MTWRLPTAEYEARKGEKNRRALRRLVGREPPPGLLAYLDRRPVGWCAVAPREAYSRLERSRVAARIDDRPVWSIVCFYVAPDCRGQGVADALLEAALDFARAHGADLVEAYPVEPIKDEIPDLFAFTGLVSMFRRAGFREVARRSPTRPVMRRELRESRSPS
jgi:GNAT superfamily N-acetyltransferase